MAKNRGRAHHAPTSQPVRRDPDPGLRDDQLQQGEESQDPGCEYSDDDRGRALPGELDRAQGSQEAGRSVLPREDRMQARYLIFRD